MRSLQVAFHSLGTKHALIEGKLLPRLEADHLVVLDFELNAALLAAKTAMRLDKAIGHGTAIEPLPRREREMRSEGIDRLRRRYRLLGHRGLLAQVGSNS